MTDGSADLDLLAGGRHDAGPRRQPREPRRQGPRSRIASAGLSRWNHLRPGTRSAVTGVALLLLVAAAFGVQSFVQRPPALPTLSFTAIPLAEGEASMHLGSRPIAADSTLVSLQLTVAPTGGSAETRISELTGAGIRSAPVIPALRSAAQPRSASVTAEVDCTQLTLPARAEDVRARVEVSDGSRSAQADVPLGPAGLVWAGEVNRLCSANLAARTLVVTQVTGRVDATRPELDLTLAVRNQGTGIGWLRLPATDDVNLATRPLEASVGAGATVEVSTHLALRRCPSWDPTRLPSKTTQTPFGLLATVGPRELAATADRPASWSFGPLPLLPDAAATLKDLMVQACGGVASPVLLSQQPHASFDRNTRTLTTRLDAYLPPNKVRRVRFLPSASTAYPPLQPSIVPTWITPDATGVASAEVSFRVPPGTTCLGGGPTVTLDIQLEVVQGGSSRQVVFTLYSETFLYAGDLAVACQS